MYGPSEIGSAYSPPSKSGPGSDGSDGVTAAAVETVIDIGHRVPVSISGVHEMKVADRCVRRAGC